MLRRLDCVLEATKPAVLVEKVGREKAGLNPEPFLLRKSGQLFYNTLTTEAQRAVDLLQERRTALISATITGQINVQ